VPDHTLDWPVSQHNEREMTALRLVPLPIHSALEMLAGLVLMAAPFVLGATADLETGDRAALAVSVHYAADYGLALGMAGAALVLAAGDPTAAAIFGAAALVQLALNLTTRYSQR
jgi:hypothetical protein